MKKNIPVVMFVAAAFIPSFASAEPQSKNTARSLIKEGNRLMDAGDYRAALARYQAAYDIFPTPKIFFNLAAANRELEQYVDAANYYEQFLLQSGVGKDSPLRKAAERQLPKILEKLATVTIHANILGATVFLDGKEAGRAPIEKLRVTPGTHQLILEQAGYERKTLSFVVRARQHEAVDVELRTLAPLLVGPAEPPPPLVSSGVDTASGVDKTSSVDVAEGVSAVGILIDDEPTNESVTSKWWFWTLLVAGAAAVAGGTALAVSASKGGDFMLEGTLGGSSVSDWERL